MVDILLGIALALVASQSARAEEPIKQQPSEVPVQTDEHSVWNPLSWKWVPSDEEIQKYRRSWNPFSHGPILNTGVDIQPKGQFLVQPFVFGQVGHEQFDNKLTTHSSDAQTHLRAVAPTLIFAYGITNHLELNVAPSWVWFEASKATASGQRAIDTDTGPGDTTIYLKYRPIVQDPDTWRPSITQYNGITLMVPSLRSSPLTVDAVWSSGERVSSHYSNSPIAD